MTILKTRNPDFGFFATAQGNYKLSDAEQDAAWSAAMHALMALHGAQAEDARNFLDSRYGRHFADSLTFIAPDSILAAIAEYRAASSARSKNLAKYAMKELRAMTPRIREDFDFDARTRGFQ